MVKRSIQNLFIIFLAGFFEQKNMLPENVTVYPFAHLRPIPFFSSSSHFDKKENGKKSNEGCKKEVRA